MADKLQIAQLVGSLLSNSIPKQGFGDAVGGGEKKKYNQEDLNSFGNWTDQTDTKMMAKDLNNRGLVGADKMMDDNVNTSSSDGIRNANSDWKVSAIQNILSNARKLNLRTPEEVNANRDVLINNPKWRDAINNPVFSQNHPNFWNIITHSILPERYAKYDKMEKDNTVKK